MPKDTKIQADIAIIGGGLAGMSLAAILGAHGISVVCVDREDVHKTLEATFDIRTTAISWGSRRVLQEAGVWDDVLPSGEAIADIHILDNGSPVLLEFLARDVNEDAFGWIFENLDLRKALIRRLQNLENVTHLAPAKVVDFDIEDDHADVILEDEQIIRAQLVVGADGRGSFTRQWAGIPVRQWSYKQSAIVCNLIHENPHKNIAVEDFRAEGPFAVLPMVDKKDGTHRSALVWSEHGDKKDSALHWDEDVFNAALNERFPEFYGCVRVDGPRAAYPLGLIHAHSYIAPRMALVADAAHGIHPIAGQGLNLGFRDIAEISTLLINAFDAKQDLGAPGLLDCYQRARRFDNTAMAGTTDLLNKLFSNNITPVRIVRKMGLRAVQRFAPARKFFMKQAMGASGILPALIKEK